MDFNEIVFLVSASILLISFSIKSFMILDYERKQLDVLRDIRKELIENNVDNDYVVNWLDNLETKLDTLDLTDITD